MRPLQEVLKELAPAGCAAAACPVGAADARLPPAEEAAVACSASSRRRQFGAGRHCARTALAQLGFRQEAIARRDDGRPRWPEGAVGSISHTSGWAAAVVAGCDDYAALGLDIEVCGRIDNRLARRVLTEEERNWMRRQSAGVDWPTVLFCARESFYKCIYPRLCRPIAFRDVAVSLDPGRGELRFRGREGLSGAAEVDLLRGRFACWKGHVLCLVWLANARLS